MLRLDLAVALRGAGLDWTPTKGDSFSVPDREMDDTVFVVSDMVIEEVRMPDGTPVLAFNGTTEWALDALESNEAIWLPREDQLRELLGDGFESMEALPPPGGGYVVLVRGRRYLDTRVENAYARALLDQLGR